MLGKCPPSACQAAKLDFCGAEQARQGGCTDACHRRAELPARKMEHLELAPFSSWPFGLRAPSDSSTSDTLPAARASFKLLPLY